jgi:preprotein translocase subunit SecE
LASNDKNKKRSSGAGSAAARKSSGTSAGSRKPSGGSSSTATKQAKGQKASAKDGKSSSGGLGGRWKRARQSAKSGSTARAAAKGEKRGLGKFLKDVRIELRKVTWPTRKDLFQSTIVVIVAVAIAGAYTGALDFIFSRIVQFFQGLMG